MAADPPSPPLALKIATLVFSLGIASTAVLHGVLVGCEATPTPATFNPEPEAIDLLPRRAPTRPRQPPPRYFGGSKSDDDVWGGLTGQASEGAAAPRYFGGAKADPDVWSGSLDVARHYFDEARPEARGPAPRSQRRTGKPAEGGR